MAELSDVVGQGIGRVFIPVCLFLWGMHRCQAVAQEKNTNPHATRGLMFSLGAWVVLLLHSAFAPMLAWQVSLVAFAGVVLLGGIGAVPSIRGLSRWSRYGRGNVHGVLGLRIGLGLCVLVLYGIVGGLGRA